MKYQKTAKLAKNVDLETMQTALRSLGLCFKPYKNHRNWDFKVREEGEFNILSISCEAEE
jgi:hypothetical protein